MENIERLTDEQMQALALYEAMVLGRIGKTKKEKYERIGKNLEINPETIKTWVARHYKSYMNYKEEIQEKDSKRVTLEGLTELEARYVKARLCGYSKEEAKDYAGYSESTKAADIEKQPKISRTLEEIRREFLEDEKHGVKAVTDEFDNIRDRAKGYTREVIDTTSFPTADGKTISRTIRQTNEFGVELAALKAKASILGYDARTLLQMQQRVNESGKKRMKIGVKGK